MLEDEIKWCKAYSIDASSKGPLFERYLHETFPKAFWSDFLQKITLIFSLSIIESWKWTRILKKVKSLLRKLDNYAVFESGV